MGYKSELEGLRFSYSFSILIINHIVTIRSGTIKILRPSPCVIGPNILLT